MTDPSATFRVRLLELLNQSVYHAIGLRECLQDELRALEAQDTGALEAAASGKSGTVVALQQLEDQRADLCTAAGFASGPGQVDDAIASCDNEGVVTGCWEHLKDVARECHDMNLTIGAVIRARQQQISAGLDALRGADPTPGTYSPAGQTTGGQAQRAIAEA